jgi:hypothetical protein
MNEERLVTGLILIMCSAISLILFLSMPEVTLAHAAWADWVLFTTTLLFKLLGGFLITTSTS